MTDTLNCTPEQPTAKIYPEQNEKLSIHHVPPKSFSGRNIFELSKPPHEHRAYHLLFGNPGPKSFDDALDVLENLWLDLINGKADTKLIRAFRTLFGDTTDPEKVAEILWKNWWTRPNRN